MQQDRSQDLLVGAAALIGATLLVRAVTRPESEVDYGVEFGPPAPEPRPGLIGRLAGLTPLILTGLHALPYWEETGRPGSLEREERERYGRLSALAATGLALFSRGGTGLFWKLGQILSLGRSARTISESALRRAPRRDSEMLVLLLPLVAWAGFAIGSVRRTPRDD